jgi:uncharacterized protein (TIGR00369 family)
MFGPIEPAAVAARDGLTLLRDVIAGRLPAPPMARAMNFTFVSAEPGRVEMSGTPTAEHLNPLGMVHGGWFATVLDSVMGCAVHTTVPRGSAYTTIEIKTNFVRALSAGQGPVRAIGEVTHPGRRIALAEGKLLDAGGKLIATGSTSCFIFEAPQG